MNPDIYCILLGLAVGWLTFRTLGKIGEWLS